MFGNGRVFFFFNDTATTEIYTLSLHDALPISRWSWPRRGSGCCPRPRCSTTWGGASTSSSTARSEEHTSELQSQSNLVCRLLLEKKKNIENDRPKCVIRGFWCQPRPVPTYPDS